MAQTKKEIQAHLDVAQMHPRHRFGQNFMIDQNLVRLIAAAGEIAAGDIVIEVGPGTGTLTEELLATPAAKVVAVEIDRDLAGMLRTRYTGEPRFELIEGDALASKHELNVELAKACRFKEMPADPPVKLVANLPYNIASPLVIELLIAGVETLAFTVQKEVADRLRAGAGDEMYGSISVMVQLLGDVEVMRTLPPQAFWPAPKIDSALVRIRRRDRLGPHAVAFSRLLHQLFSARRKTIRKALAQAELPAEKIITALGLDPLARPETLSPQTLWAVFQQIG
ncbi:16S rRNA (adenine(1518)-N(6)/adenine(1519)-N(6))-dimethyltransferaseRsmA [soil metagenome]